jgi:DNA repair protein RadA/Sms
VTKQKNVFFCSSCGNESPKWVGKCPQCNEWNTYVEERITLKKNLPVASRNETKAVPELIQDGEGAEEERLFLPDVELNRVLGGGLVKGSVVLLGGEPGIGKSTLLLQNVLHSNFNCLYISGEESKSQIHLRAKRIGIRNENCYVLPETLLDNIIQTCKQLQPELLVIDSIQTLESSYLDSAPGTVSQVKESTSQLIKIAKTLAIPILIVGHINKDGALAGPKVLEHMVDVVLQFEGEKNYQYRTLRTLKNRFGSTHEIGLYEMNNEGLQPVTNPSDILISDNTDALSGVAIGASVEGNTPLLIEVQALVSPAVYGTPQRNTTGYDMKRLGMLLAVLEKRSGFQLVGKDVFVNITGGFKPADTGLDLAVAAAIMSSYLDIPLPKTTAFAGEIGLSGEVRGAFRLEQRIAETEKLGLNTLVISSFSKIPPSDKRTLHLHTLSKTDDLLSLLS